MPVQVIAAGSVAYSTAGGSTVAPSYPQALTALDGAIMFVGQKPSTANSGSVSTPAGWSALGNLNAAGGYGTTLGVDTGNTNLYCFSLVAAGGESGSVSVSLSTNNVAWAQIIQVRNGSFESWNLANPANGSDTSAGTAVSVATQSMSWQAGDFALWAFCEPTAVNAGAQFSAHQISSSGLGFGTATEIAEAATTNGNDIGGFTAWALATSGSGTVSATLAAVAATGTNARGPGLVVRIRPTVNQALAGAFMPFLN